MKPDPLVTVGITSFNAEDSIEKCIDSALNQKYKNKEIVIVDDGSTDKTPKILLDYEKKYPEIKVVIKDKNYNCAHSLNIMLKEANGEFIVYFDDDDVSVPNRISKLLERLLSYEIKHNTKNVFVYSNRYVKKKIGINSKRKKEFIMPGIGRQNPEPKGPIVADYLLKVKSNNDKYCWGEIGRCTMLARLELIKELDGFDENFSRCAEIDLAVRASMKGTHFISVNESLITYYVTTGSHKTLKKDLKARIQLVKKNRKYLIKKSLYCASLLNFYAWYWHVKKVRIFGWFFRGLHYSFKLKNKLT